MGTGSTKVRGAVRRARGLVITATYKVWRRTPLKLRLGTKKIAAKLPKSVLAKLQRGTGLQVPVKAQPKPTFTAAELAAASVRPDVKWQTHQLYFAPLSAPAHTALAASVRNAGLSLHTVSHNGLGEADRAVASAVAQVSDQWQREELDWVAAHFSHVLSVGGQALFGELFNRAPALVEAELLRGLGVRTGFLLSDSVRKAESDLRDNPYSPFGGSGIRSQRAEEQIRRLVNQLTDIDLPLFVDSPDLIGALPNAHWLPVVVGAEPAAESESVTEPAAVPEVVQIWVNDARPAQREVAKQLEQLAQSGAINYRRIDQRQFAAQAAGLGLGTIVVDDLQHGTYSVAAAHGLGAGAAMLANVTELNRERIAALTSSPLPIAQCEPETFSAALADLLAAPERRTELAAAAQSYAQEVHSGALAAAQLKQHLLGTGA